MTQPCKLSELPLQTTAIVKGFDRKTALTERMNNLGITEGTPITPVFRSPFGDPVAYSVRDSLIALRKSDCDGVWVTAAGDGDA